MKDLIDRPPTADPAARAMEDLRLIRATLERAEGFTVVPGTALAAVGVLALLAAGVARFGLRVEAGTDPWVAVWATAAVLAFATGLFALVRKARRHGIAVARGLGRKLLLGLGAPLAAGLVLTGALLHAGARDLLAGTWLSLYGAGVVAAGAFSTRSVPALGAACMALGAVALFVPAASDDALLALGFGGLHLLVGWRIARRHGG